MKTLFQAYVNCASYLSKAGRILNRDKKVRIFLLMLTTGFVLMGCQKEDVSPPDLETQPVLESEVISRNVAFDYEGLNSQTVWELQQARAATARYRNINHAFADGYANISVVVPNMGHHFMRSTIVDATFDYKKPEILVYNPDEDGNFELVAVEYAVPISLTPNSAPAGFTGSNDVWDKNTGFGLWLLHAWVWQHNPLGVFNPTNPDVHLHP